MMQKAGIEDKPTVEYEIIVQLKGKYAKAQRSEKVQLLTILPKSWSFRKIEAEFVASNFMVRKAKELVREKGIMSTKNPKPGRSLPQTTIDLSSSFMRAIKQQNDARKEGLHICKNSRRTHYDPKEAGSHKFAGALSLV